MMQSSIFEHFYNTGVIPVLEIDSVHRAVPLAESLSMGGLPVAEVTLRTEAALDAIRAIAHARTGIVVGAGTILNVGHAQAARDAGAQFLVSPGMTEEVVGWAQENHMPVLAGAVTPSEMMRGLNLGLSILKFFPAESMGGLKAIRALSDPFPQLRFMPTGGINPSNLAEYLQMEKIHAVGGSWMAKRQMIAEAQFAEITRLAKEASDLVKQVRSKQT